VILVESGDASSGKFHLVTAIKVNLNNVQIPAGSVAHNPPGGF